MIHFFSSFFASFRSLPCLTFTKIHAYFASARLYFPSVCPDTFLFAVTNSYYRFSGEVPLDSAITETSDSGTPIVISQPDSLYVSYSAFKLLTQ